MIQQLTQAQAIAAAGLKVPAVFYTALPGYSERHMGGLVARPAADDGVTLAAYARQVALLDAAVRDEAHKKDRAGAIRKLHRE